MKIVVIADDNAWSEWSLKTIPAHIEVIRVGSPEEINAHLPIDACFDLVFESSEERLLLHSSLYPAPVFACCVALTTQQLHTIRGNSDVSANWNTVRINAWPTFFKRSTMEIAATDIKFEHLFKQLGWQYEVTPDIPGFITARVVSMIINEAWFALEENVSTKEEIDTAMKLGTNYPYGPFEWGEKIGLKNIHDLLSSLAANNNAYRPSALLAQQVLPA